ncbi:MAG: hypothetical protein ACRDJE_13190 [Dehalococcoidia bacterium]
MTQITQEEWNQQAAAAERVGAKLKNFLAALPDDEQQVLTTPLISLSRLVADEQGDVSGHTLGAKWVSSIAQSYQEHPAAWTGAAIALDTALGGGGGGNWGVLYRFLAK